MQERKELKQDYREQKDLLKHDYKEQKHELKDNTISDENLRQDQREQKDILKQDLKEQKGRLRQDYKEQSQKIKELREASMTNVRGRLKNSLSGFLRFIVMGLLVLFQMLIIIFLPLLLRQYTILFYLVLELLSFLVAVGLTNANKNASFKVAWMSIALLLPVSGHIMYYLWGRNSTRKKLVDRTKSTIARSYPYLADSEEMAENFYENKPQAKRISKYLRSSHYPLYANNQTKYYSMGEDVFKDLFEDMLNAKDFILVGFFIVAEGALLDTFLEIAKFKIKEGVEIKFLYDDFGAMLRTDKDFPNMLNEIGIETRIFNPIHRYTDKLIMNYRTHEKIVVIDGKVGYTGGFNLADEYANLITRFGVWKDCGLQVKGEAVWGLSMTFLQLWSICKPDVKVDYLRYKVESENSPEIINGNAYCHVISDGPAVSNEHIMESLYMQLIEQADLFLYIMTPYLIPEEHMIQVIIEAVKRGVDVRIITPNIPDKKKVKLLTNYNYGQLLENGVKIYEYTPGFIHSKVIMNEFSAVVGTVNMDYRSFYLHYENAVWVCDDATVSEIYEDFVQTFNISTTITYEEWLDRPLKYKISQPLLNLFSTLI